MSMDMLLETEGVPLYIPIWFYSNMRQFAFLIPSLPLHSNMVLFKSCALCQYTFYSFFTFQYGSIQIQTLWLVQLEMLSLHSNMVLFKLLWLAGYVLRWRLYIPIWFYSNTNVSKDSNTCYHFTFQYGSIQIKRYD